MKCEAFTIDSAVHLRSLAASTIAPRSRRSWTTFKWPQRLASMSGVTPLSVSTSTGSAFNDSSTRCESPDIAARWMLLLGSGWRL